MSAGAESAIVRVMRLAHGADLPLPAPASPGSAGADLRAAVDAPLVVAPGERCLVPTGIALELPPGWEGQVRPRSGLALRHGVTLLNSPGTIDSDYRGEVAVVLINLGHEPFTVERGDRIAQLVVAPVAEVRWEAAEALASSRRQDGGFGSSGRR
jgi:dUTP pyrophosphatase